MRIVAAAHRLARWELDGRGAARGLRERSALVLEVQTAHGARGQGEAAPLPGLSLDTLADAARALEALAARVPLEAGDGLDAFAVLAADAAPDATAARFAIEAALTGALAAERGTTLEALLDAVVGAPGWPGPPPSVVVDDEGEARAAAAAGGRALKIKVGPGGDLDRVRAIAAAAPGVRLRLDANRTWPRAAVRERLATLASAGLPIDYIEEPCAASHELLGEALAIPIALDESLAELARAAPDALDAALAAPGLGALILKPTLLGLAGTVVLAARARAARVPAIVTHCLESPVGRAACAALASAIAGSPDRAAAPAVTTGDRTLTFADIAARAPVHRDPAARCVIAHPTVETIAAVHAALAERRPIALFHPRLPEPELARRRDALEAARLPADAAVILFTSGSTGAARGVVLSRDALDAAADASARHLGWRDGDRWLLALSPAHAGGLAVIVRCLAARRPVELVPDGAPLAPALAAATLASLVPAQLAALLDDPAWRPPPGLRAVLLGGAAAPPSLLAAAAARGVPFLATYGMTETFGQIATMPPARAGDPAAPLALLPNVSLAAGTRAAPAPIRVAGPMLATCYLDGAPIAPAFVTADLGFLDEADTALHVVGRADDVIVTGGAKVHPLEVEAVLAATPGVRAACVFAVPDERWGQIVGVALATAPDFDFDLAAAAARWRAALPPHARPRRLALAADLPLSPTGKLDRRAAARLPHAPVIYARPPA
ncbi:MAG TPA: AMP-binding protein [Kofleriaceae bacterium]|nr:AMP-binding protein [Kofleriaceae bacterium]